MRGHMSRFFFFNDTATTEIYTLALHDALPICPFYACLECFGPLEVGYEFPSITRAQIEAGPTSIWRYAPLLDRKSTRLNSSHANISYAVFCLKKKIELPVEPKYTPLNSLHANT